MAPYFKATIKKGRIARQQGKDREENPYITDKDGAFTKKYRDLWYQGWDKENTLYTRNK